ncbi:MAG: hypothetical protein KatS3mg113_0521 [Planctomycetaceae bacterium]|nr:MAG: hypothetical protein KatS3mg113_0521 [Planctomycetaceae bacterium]
MGTGVDPHLYRPTRRDVKRLLGAQLIVSNGLRLEGRMEELFDQLRRLGKHVWALGDLIPTQRLRYPGEGSHPDPHIWMDVGLWRHGLERLYEKLAADTFFQPWLSPERFTDYLRDLRELDVYIHGVIQSIPAVQRVLVTAHDAFGYFGRAYGIEVRGLQGVSTESEAGVHDVRSLIEFLVERKIPAIFVETSVNPRLVEAVLAGCRARHWPVQLGGTLFSDAMGPPGDYTGTYLGMMDANATTIARGLGGHVPPGGWRGLLPATAMSVHSNHAKSINS